MIWGLNTRARGDKKDLGVTKIAGPFLLFTHNNKLDQDSRHNIWYEETFWKCAYAMCILQIVSCAV